MFIAVLLTIVKMWKQTKCTLIDEWIKKMWCTYTMEHYSDIKNEILLLMTKWMDLESFMISQTGKDKYSAISLICII